MKNKRGKTEFLRKENHMKRKLENPRKDTGITLVALVITILIIIILAIVAINLAFGDNGLIKRAEDARDYYANDTAYTDETLANLDAYLDEMIPFTPQSTPEPEQGDTELADMTNGVIEIKWLKGTSYNVSSSPNAPVIKTDLPEGTTMEQVVFNEENNTWEAGTEYSYVKGTKTEDNTSSHWANAKVTKNGVESYFVWIPRYAYRIVYFNSLDSKNAYLNGELTEEQGVAEGKIIGYSDSRGIVDAEGKKLAGVASTTKTMVSSDYFMVHPAFIADVDAGGWTSELPGIWVGKFESSSVEGNSDSTAGDNTTAKTVKVQPGVSSWRYIDIGNMYTVSKAYAEELNSHMLKNSEWGAVAYLTESAYGRNGTEIGFNQSSSFTTGGGTENAYVDLNQNQSSTGNAYGIYDLRGGSWEYVTGYLKGGSLENGAFANGTSDEYSTVYDSDVEKTAYKYGDATYETHGWHQDYANFVNSDYSCFNRGGYYYNSADNTGVFGFGRSDSGASNSTYSFRLGLVM